MKILGSGGANRSEFHPGLVFHPPGPQKPSKKGKKKSPKPALGAHFGRLRRFERSKVRKVRKNVRDSERLRFERSESLERSGTWTHGAHGPHAAPGLWEIRFS